MSDAGSELASLGESHRPLRELVADRLRREIVTGELAAGRRLIERDLAATLGVSRNPVREALRSLEAAGLVEVRPRRGAFVAAPDFAGIADLMSVRRVIECHAAGLAADHRTSVQVVALRSVLDRGEAASYRGDHLDAAAAHERFHALVDDMTGNPYIALASQPLRQRTELVFSLLSESRGDVQWTGHEAIFRAIADGDRAAAVTAVGAHVDAVVEALLAQHRR